VNAITATIRSAFGRQVTKRVASFHPAKVRPDWMLRMAKQHLSLSFDRSSNDVIKQKSVLTAISHPSQNQKFLLARVANNDVGAMEQCIQDYSSLVWNLVKRRVSSHAAAEDLVQEIFTEIWKCAGRFDAAQGNETTFIAMIARRRVIDWTRKQTRGPEWVALPDNLDDLSATIESPSSSVADHEAIASLVKTLPEQTQQLFEMHFDRGLTQQEIAQSTDLPLGTVKTLLRRGLLEIRSCIFRKSSSESLTSEAG
jgi:RNA polymerase sigma-70 factor (ECF subfamily)